MVHVRTDFCFLLVACFIILCQSENFGSDSDKSLVGVVKNMQSPEKLPWGKVSDGFKFGMYTGFITLPNGVSLEKTWENIYKGYYMKCFKDSRDGDPKFRVSVYYRPSLENVFLTFDVKNCEDELLQSVIMSKRRLRNHNCVLLFTDGCWQLKLDREGEVISEKRCKTLSTSQSGKGSDEYINNWKAVTEEESRKIIEMEPELKNLEISIPCEEGSPGEFMNFEYSELIAWGIQMSSVMKKHTAKVWYELSDGVKQRNAWTNCNRGGYFMKCYENIKLKMFRATIYDQPRESIRPLVTMAVTSCSPQILNSITMMSYQMWTHTHTLMLHGKDQCCRKYEFNYKDKLKVSPCPPKNKRSQKNDDNYINGWKNVPGEHLEAMTKKKALKEAEKKQRSYVRLSSDDSSNSS